MECRKCREGQFLPIQSAFLLWKAEGDPSTAQARAESHEGTHMLKLKMQQFLLVMYFATEGSELFKNRNSSATHQNKYRLWLQARTINMSWISVSTGRLRNIWRARQ